MKFLRRLNPFERQARADDATQRRAQKADEADFEEQSPTRRPKKFTEEKLDFEDVTKPSMLSWFRPRRWLRPLRYLNPVNFVEVVEWFSPERIYHRIKNSRLKWRSLLAALPAPLVILSIGTLLFLGQRSSGATQLQYRTKGRLAFEAGEIDKARFYYSRLINEGDRGSSIDELNWASMLASSGDTKAAMKLLDKLAPDDAVGFGPAHRQKAIMYIGAIRSGQASGAEAINRTQWHLKHGARDESIESHQLWTAYYFITGQTDNAINRQVLSAQLNPDLWLEAAALCGTKERMDDRKRFLGRAEAHARQSLATNPLDSARRLMLVRVLVDRDELDTATRVLQEGIQLEDSAAMKRALSDLVLLRMERLPPPAADASEIAVNDHLRTKVRLIGQATQLDPGNPTVYRAWASLHDSITAEESRKKIREHLERLIVDGEAVPFAHFTLGGILWTSGEQSKSIFHMEKAFALDVRFMDAANNLAWMLANQEQPDLERAEQLILRALEQNPNDVRYRDTLGEVLTRQKRWDEALVVLEQVLPVAIPSQKPDLHRRLAIVYGELGEENLAKMHQEKAARE